MGETVTVWHLCQDDYHWTHCRDFLTVHMDCPDLLPGNLRMELHPLEQHVERLPSGQLVVRRALAMSQRHSVEQLIPAPEVARRLKLSTEAVRKRLRDKVLPAKKYHGRWFVNSTDLLNYSYPVE